MALAQGNSLAFAQFPQDVEEHDDHLNRVLVVAQEKCRQIAAACYSEVILSLESSPPVESFKKMLVVLKAYCEGLGLGLTAAEGTSAELLAVLKDAGLTTDESTETSSEA